jgi:hypothetical protein
MLSSNVSGSLAPKFNPHSAVPADAMSEEQTCRSEESLSLRLIRLRRKWISALRKFTGSNCSKRSNGSKRFVRQRTDQPQIVWLKWLEQLERFFAMLGASTVIASGLAVPVSTQ